MTALTADQMRAVTANGDVLVVAGAGTGKTKTLVERCLARIGDPDQPIALDRMLVVTFTEAAAAELRKRIRTRLEDWSLQHPNSAWLTEQLALVESARISTLHGFCLRLVRDHFHQLHIDPEVLVLSQEQSILLGRETLDALLRRRYRGELGDAAALQRLVLEHGRGWDEPVRQMILRLHEYTQTLRDPGAWFERERRLFSQPEPHHWWPWLQAVFAEWRAEWLEALAEHLSAPAQACLAILEPLTGSVGRVDLAAALAAILDVDQPGAWPRGQKKRLREPLEPFFAEAAFLESLARREERMDPLAEDWGWVREPMRLLLELARRFGEDFSAAKRGLGAVDFHDLEQFALDLVWDRATDQPTALADRLRRQLDLIFVDEYQDINEAPDTILRALSREQPAANRFLVGDVKQSIYRFRLANPRIFQEYTTAWSQSGDRQGVVHLTENFRSHEQIVEFVNRLFSPLMRSALGGVAYDTTQHLQFGASDQRSFMRTRPGESPRVELHLLLADGDSQEAPLGAGFADEDRAPSELEAEWIARRLARLRTDRLQIWDSNQGQMRDVGWRDMAILLRSPGGKAEVYAKVFESLGVPLVVARGGYYDSAEVIDLLSLLQVLDNPLQDLPLLTVLRSPWVALTPDELALIRWAAGSSYYWTALRRFHRQNRSEAAGATPGDGDGREAFVAGAWRKVDRFLGLFLVWRRKVRRESLSACLEAVLEQTGYEGWLANQSRASQRLANVQRLLVLTRQFDEFQRQGLFRFLGFVEAQKAAGIDVEPAALSGADAVRLLSIHQSKGLEFPVVVVADLGKPFNFEDLSARIILDETFGLCPQVLPPAGGGRYPSLPYWLAQRRQRRETLGEETRLLYVALTRACDFLVLSGSSRTKTIAGRWTPVGAELPLRRLISAGCYLDWLGAVLPQMTGHTDWRQGGARPGFAWQVYHPGDLIQARAEQTQDSPQTAPPTLPSPEQLRELKDRLAWRYPFQPATIEPAKTTVSALRRRGLEERDEDATDWMPRRPVAGLTGADVGIAHHLFLESMSLDQAGDLSRLRAEGSRLVQSGRLSPAELAALDLEAIAAFWQSPVGTQIRDRSDALHREMPFTARFELVELTKLGLMPPGDSQAAGERLGSEWVIVQGVVDLAVVLDDQIWVLDFKTDQVRSSDLHEKMTVYQPQLRLYAAALERIYARPVSRVWIHFFGLRETVSVA